MKAITAILCLLSVVSCSTEAISEQITISCKFVGSERPGLERAKDVDQIYIDTDLPAVELRVAKTMGTPDQLSFGFRNRQVKGMTDDKILLYFLGAKMSMAAIRLGVPTAIVLDRLSGSMVWSWADESGSWVYRYRCKP